jgi:hypothetical protein
MIYVSIGKITWLAILDFRSTILAISKSLRDHLELPPQFPYYTPWLLGKL